MSGEGKLYDGYEQSIYREEHIRHSARLDEEERRSAIAAKKKADKEKRALRTKLAMHILMYGAIFYFVWYAFKTFFGLM